MARALYVIALGLFSTAAFAATDPTGQIGGKLTITRVLTKKRVVLPGYQDRGAFAHTHGKDAGPVNEWARVVVYLEGADGPKRAPVTVPIDQRGERFEPDNVVVPVGSTVSFPNSDPIFHNVFSLSKTRQFDLGYYPAGESRLIRFDQPGIVQVYCHLHPDMSAAVLVVPNGWYLRPDNQGQFFFSGIPNGAYELVVWHKSAGFFRRHVEVVAGRPVNVAIEIPVESD